MKPSKVFAASVALLVPLVSAWVVSSIAAYHGGPKTLALTVALLFLVATPVAWEVSFKRHNRSQGLARRLVLRSMIVNVLLMIVLLVAIPERVFTALSARGDWMFDGAQGGAADFGRGAMHRLAAMVEWSYGFAHHSEYEKYADKGRRPEPESTGAPKPMPPAQGVAETSPDASASEPVASRRRSLEPTSTETRVPKWPLPTALHPAVLSLPSDRETSIESVATYIGEKEKDPFERVKALHDYVADRVAYDVPSYLAHEFPPQDAETVFRTHKAVCAGYATLLAALGKAIGEDIVVVVGDARTSTAGLNGEGHAWNFVRIENHWYLIDATWDAGSVGGSTFTKSYRTSYLFAPPEVFAISHYPEEASWQLIQPPIERGDFVRQPMLRAQFFAAGLHLESPTRSQVDVAQHAELFLRNPQQQYLMASFLPETDGAKVRPADGERCQVHRQGDIASVVCDLPHDGAYRITLWASPVEFGSYEGVGELEVNRRG